MRLFVITAPDAPVAAVLRRGPSDWWHVGRWSLDPPGYEPGAWFKGSLYPQKCDLSPDGRWLLYSALQARATWAAGTVFEAVSRLPWLEALAAWEEGTTYTRGAHFDVTTRGTCGLGDPEVGDAGRSSPGSGSWSRDLTSSRSSGAGVGPNRPRRRSGRSARSGTRGATS